MPKLKIQIASDLHLQINDYPLLDPKDIQGDILVLAGDLHEDPIQLVEWMKDLTDKPIVYVLGNHEFYGHTTEDCVQDFLDVLRERDRTYLLDDTTFTYTDIEEVGGVVVDQRKVVFYGSTLWTDLPQPSDKVAMGCMNDFRLITPKSTGAQRPAIAAWMRERNALSRLFYKELLALPREPTEVRIAVSHHAPTWRSEHPRWAGSQLSGAFYNAGMDQEIDQVDIWVHGHTHDSHDYMFNKTRVICNPHGYRGENQYGFEKTLIVEV